MDFLLTAEQRAFRRDLRMWLERHLPPGWRDGRFWPALDPAAEVEALRAWERKVHAAGYAVVHWPACFGGRGLSIVEHFIVGDECGRVAAPEGINAIGRELAGAVLLHVGSEAQKRVLLPRIAACEDVWCQGFSEPNAGSDLASLATRAAWDGSLWRVNGQKIWTSYAQHADMCLLLARTAQGTRQSDGLTLFAVPMTTPGIECRPIRQLHGQSEFNEVFFTDVALPANAPIGPVGDGWRIVREVFGIERATTRLYRQARYEHELRHALRVAGGRADAGARQRAGASLAQLRVLRALNVKFVSEIAAGRRFGFESSVLKLCWSEFHQEAMDAAAELLGEELWHPDPDDADASRFLPLYLYTRSETILAGTSQIQKEIIADRLLDLAREASR